MMPTSHFGQYQPRGLEIIDTTLRDGTQSPELHDHYKYFFTTDDKVEIVRALVEYGVKFIELFAPVVSQQEASDFRVIRQARDDLAAREGHAFLLAHVRTHPDDVEAAIQAGFDGLNFYMGTSEQSRAHNHGRNLSQIARSARGLLEDVRTNHPGMILRFSGEDAFRTPEDDLFRVYDEVAPFVDRFGTPDTVGVATPGLVAARVRALRARYPGVELEGHFHDDRGFSLINALEASKSGMRYMNTTILGLAERSGITSMTALLYNLYIEREFDRLAGYHLRGSYPINVMMADKMRKLVPSKEPVSLTNRTHTAGVHAKAVLNDASVYEAHPLDQFGVTESEILLGPLSGWNVIHYFLHEICGFDVKEVTARQIAAAYKKRVYQIAPGESPARILIDIAEREYGLEAVSVPDQYRGAVQQNMTDSGAGGEVGEIGHASGVILRSKSR